MFLLAHTGITLGSALFLGKVLSKDYSHHSPQTRAVASVSSSPRVERHATHTDDNLPWFTSMARRMDYRLILVGSLLPDIIDKPVGTFLFPEFFGANRIFCHTLLFLVIISSAAVYLFKRQGQTWLIALSFGTFVHLILDQMWLAPRTLLWPAYGWAFEREDLTNWLQNMLHALLTNPAVYLPELVGAMILVGFMAQLVYRKRVYAFIRKGTI
jgi:inner membrane protein